MKMHALFNFVTMGFGGTVATMIASIKGNRALAHKKKSLREIAKEYTPAKNKDPLHYENNFSSEERKMFRLKLIRKKRQSKIQIILVLSLLVVACVSIIISLSFI